jgi:hypothetical protein
MCSLVPVVPATTLSCSVPENSGVGVVVSCSPPIPSQFVTAWFGGQLDVVTNNGSGTVHPFVMGGVGVSGELGVKVGPLVGSSTSAAYALNYEALAQYRMGATLCVPQSVSAFVGYIGSNGLLFGSCSAAQHTSIRLTIVIAVSNVDEAPVFGVTNVSFSTPGVASPGDVVGFPLSVYVSDPDNEAPFNTLVFSVGVGGCGVSVPSDIAARGLPFGIGPASGELSMLPVVATTPLSSWSNPLLCCVRVTDGGGLSASMNVTVVFTEVKMQLSVFPDRLSVTHYSFGQSTSNVTVSYYAGSHAGVTWRVGSVSARWLSAARLSGSRLEVTWNSTALATETLHGITSQSARLVVETTGNISLQRDLDLCVCC